VIRSAYGPRREAKPLVCGKSMTKQSMKDECDVNLILARYVKTGLLSHVQERSPVYADVSEMGDFREALGRVDAVRDFFAGLPSQVRAFFKNDPATFLDFMSDEANREKAEELGLVKKEEVAPAVAPAVAQ